MITIAIPVYNRLDLLKITADSLSKIDQLLSCNIRVYDDNSSEYGIDELHKIFPNAATIRRNDKNYKADGNMFLFYRDFLASGDEYLFNADSDFIFKKDFLAKALELIEQSDGVLSVFNATSHPVKSIYNEHLCIKDSIGAAGTLFKRKRVEEIMSNFSALDPGNISSFDWKWSRYLGESNVRIFCTINSLVQHIGYLGQNTLINVPGFKKIKTHKPFFDYGRNFIVDSSENGQVINDIFEKFIDQNRNEEERVLKEIAKLPFSVFKTRVKKILTALKIKSYKTNDSD